MDKYRLSSCMLMFIYVLHNQNALIVILHFIMASQPLNHNYILKHLKILTSKCNHTTVPLNMNEDSRGVVIDFVKGRVSDKV